MTAQAPDLSCVVVASDEGPRIGITLHSALNAATAARNAGLTVEVLVVLGRPTTGTRAALSEAADHGAHVVVVDTADAGVVRNEGAAAAAGTHVAFLDGDALWSENWLAAGHALCATGAGRVIAHPEIHWFYEQGRELYFPPAQDDPAFDPALLRFGSCWDGQPMAAASVFRDMPFPAVGDDAEAGRLAWEWNAATVAAGYAHRVVPGTLNFARRRPRTLR